MRRGNSLIEIIIVAGIIAVFAAISVISLSGRRGTVELDGVVKQLSVTLREAQSRSMSQASSSAWGVYFDNSTSTAPYFSLYAGTYSASSRSSYHRLPSSVVYATSSLAAGATTSISFAQITGLASASSSIKIQMLNDSRVSSTLRVSSSGAISF